MEEDCELYFVQNELVELGYLNVEEEVSFSLDSLKEEEIHSLAQRLCEQREYPRSLGCRNIKSGEN